MEIKDKEPLYKQICTCNNWNNFYLFRTFTISKLSFIRYTSCWFRISNIILTFCWCCLSIFIYNCILLRWYDLIINSIKTELTIKPVKIISAYMLYKGVVKLYESVAFKFQEVLLENKDTSKQYSARHMRYFMLYGAIPITYCLFIIMNHSMIAAIEIKFGSGSGTVRSRRVCAAQQGVN